MRMQKSRNLISVIMGTLVLILCATITINAENPSLALDSVLDFLPAAGPEKGNQLLGTLITQEGEHIRSLCQGLLSPGEGDDSRIRLALHGLASYVGRPDGQKDREIYVKVLAKHLKSDLSPEVKDFLIRQLQWAGHEESIEALAPFLLDERLVEKTVQALTAIGTGDARRALRSALPQAQKDAQIHLIHALAALRDSESLNTFLRYASSEDPGLRLSALHGLANLGDPAARKTMAKAIRAEDPYERAKYTAWYLLYARRLAEEGHPRLAVRICKRVRNRARASRQVHVECSALFAWADVAGEKAIDKLLSALDKGDSVLRTTLLSYLVTWEEEEVTDRLIRKMSRSGPQLQSLILAVLGQRGDPSAIPAVLEALRDPKDSVRLAAIPVAASLAREESLPGGLLDLLENGNGDEVKAARAGILSIPGEEVVDWVAGALRQTQSESMKLHCIDILSQRASKMHLDLIEAGVRDTSDEVRMASAKVLGQLGGPHHLSCLLPLLEEDKMRTTAERAIASITVQMPEKERSVGIMRAIPSATTQARCSMIRILGRNGDEQALAVVRDALRSSNEDLKDAAVRSLAGWPNDLATKDLWPLAQEAPLDTHRILAFRAYTERIAKNDRLSLEEKAELLEDAMDAAPRSDEKRIVLGYLGSLIHAKALRLAASCLREEELLEEAGVACVNILRSSLTEDPEASAEILKTVMDGAKNEDTLKKARELMAELQRSETHLTKWLGIGPFGKEGKSAEELFHIRFPPEDSSVKDMEWRTVEIQAGEGSLAVDLHRIFDSQGPCVGYLKTAIFVPEAQEAILAVGSDDGVKVFLNEEVVLSRNEMRSFVPDQDTIQVSLRAEWNSLLLKITEGGGDWMVSARLYGLDGKKIEGWKVVAK